MCFYKRIRWTCGCVRGRILVGDRCQHHGTPECRPRHLLDRHLAGRPCHTHSRRRVRFAGNTRGLGARRQNQTRRGRGLTLVRRGINGDGIPSSPSNASTTSYETISDDDNVQPAENLTNGDGAHHDEAALANNNGPQVPAGASPVALPVATPGPRHGYNTRTNANQVPPRAPTPFPAASSSSPVSTAGSASSPAAAGHHNVSSPNTVPDNSSPATRVNGRMTADSDDEDGDEDDDGVVITDTDDDTVTDPSIYGGDEEE